MPQPSTNWSAVVGNRLIFEHQQLHSEAQQADAEIIIDRLNNDQRTAYDAITSLVFENKGTIFFLNGGTGTGKTFLYNAIALKCRSLGHIVITVASSRIASLLLVGGHTAHSTFSIPLDVLENSICGFSKQSLQAELFRETKLIIWDEVPMQHRHCVEAVDRTLRDTCDSEKPYGGITVVLGGDFRQILPVITKGVREQIVNALLRYSFLWKDTHVLSLNLNMRLNHANLGNANFAKFLMEIGTNPQEIVKLLSTIHKCQDLKDLISVVYPQLDVAMTSTATFLTERTILSARNDDVSAINTAALNIFPDNIHTYLAADKMSEDDEIDHPPGLPAFKVELKVGCPIMLLRNIAPKDGLCNGTRLIVSRCNTRIIEAQILTGEKCGNLVFIPRISLTPSSSEMPFRMTRRQFPVRLAYALTINKSQGQSVNFVGVDLRTPVFSHGQLYVALSRCTSFDRISVLLPNDEPDYTTNIVYPELLL
ncbi:ATP-dependent DNA helicase PIF7-like [Camellia sinensis]|uniref:ATP-dependent DNA helicase PIF7-like n=1 Tax=Camellia sinensis TaxID=4442 RepID=UPI001035BC2F|nr:ATP-dependent DNA helicase PIF7-like [Camellia sinensis]